MAKKPNFQAGPNIAMKVPSHQHQDTVRFYRDILGLKAINALAPDPVFQFGDKQLWIDKVDDLSQAEIWLEIVTDDITAAAQWFEAHDVVRCDEIETLPDGLKAFWVSSSASIIHLVNEAPITEFK